MTLKMTGSAVHLTCSHWVHSQGLSWILRVPAHNQLSEDSQYLSHWSEQQADFVFTSGSFGYGAFASGTFVSGGALVSGVGAFGDKTLVGVVFAGFGGFFFSSIISCCNYSIYFVYLSACSCFDYISSWFSTASLPFAAVSSSILALYSAMI